MNETILTWLRRQSDTMPVDVSPTLGNFVYHWRDHLQTDEARAALTDDLVLENTVDESKEGARLEAIKGWLVGPALNAWLTLASVPDAGSLPQAIIDAMMKDGLNAWPSTNDSMGACGVTSASFITGVDTVEQCTAAARISGKSYDETVKALQTSLREVLVALCS